MAGVNLDFDWGGERKEKGKRRISSRQHILRMLPVYIGFLQVHICHFYSCKQA